MKKIEYSTLNPKQQESYNYQKLSAILADYGYTTYRMHVDFNGADYGYTTYRMHVDFNGADFHAIGVEGDILKVQLKGRISIERKYLRKDILIGFSDKNQWYLYPHDEIHKIIINHSLGAAKSGGRSMRDIPKWLIPIMEKYKI